MWFWNRNAKTDMLFMKSFLFLYFPPVINISLNGIPNSLGLMRFITRDISGFRLTLQSAIPRNCYENARSLFSGATSAKTSDSNPTEIIQSWKHSISPLILSMFLKMHLRQQHLNWNCFKYLFNLLSFLLWAVPVL